MTDNENKTLIEAADFSGYTFYIWTSEDIVSPLWSVPGVYKIQNPDLGTMFIVSIDHRYERVDVVKNVAKLFKGGVILKGFEDEWYDETHY